MIYNDKELIIRDICDKDATILFSWWIDKEVNKYDPRPIPMTNKELKEECMTFYNKFDTEIMNDDPSLNKYKYFIIESENKQIGFINLFGFNKDKKEAELGIIIGNRDYLNKGIGTKSLKIILNHVFDELDLSRIYIETSSNNLPAIKLFSKVGFKHCGEYFEEEFKFIVMEYLN